MEKAMTELTSRQIREMNYYSQFALNFDVNKQIDFSPIEGPLLEKERRPWNSYWRTYEIVVDHHKDHPSQKTMELLDFGCGPGDNALKFRRAGYYVTGFDICEKNIETCNKLFELNGHENGGFFLVSPAEKLPFADESFDVVAGIDILHHVDIPQAILEVRRVLKNNGIAIFREPIEVPFFDRIRNSKLILHFFPNKASLEAHITEDERKLNYEDLRAITKIFPEITIERSLIVSRFDKFFRRHNNSSPSFLEKCDYYLSKLLPVWANLGGAAVIIVSKKKRSV